MNTSALKSYKLWIAVATAIAGVLLSQGVFLEGSTVSQIVGWILTFVGAGSTGAQVKAPAEEPAAPTA
jgi:hypothetical protein